jgi:hypothetical protein
MFRLNSSGIDAMCKRERIIARMKNALGKDFSQDLVAALNEKATSSVAPNEDAFEWYAEKLISDSLAGWKL